MFLSFEPLYFGLGLVYSSFLYNARAASLSGAVIMSAMHGVLCCTLTAEVGKSMYAYYQCHDQISV